MAVRTPATFASAVTEGQLARFQELSRLHDDGWGAAWLEGDGVALHRSVLSAQADPEFGAVAAGHPTRAGIMHLRWASSDMANDDANTHPFRADGMAFAHNGFVGPAEAVDRLVPPGIDVAGTTDSERYFAVVRGFQREGLEPADAVMAAVALLRRNFPRSSLNALVLTANELIAVNANSDAEIDIESMLAAGFTIDTLPTGHSDEYYQLYVRRGEDGVAIASTGLDSDGWEPLPEESVTVIRLDSGEVEHRLLSAHAGA